MLIIVIINVLFVQTVLSCSCSANSTDPINQYCQSDFAALVTIDGKQDTNETSISDIWYHFAVKSIMMNTNKNGYKALKARKFYTSNQSSLCGLDLEVDKSYLIAAKVSQNPLKINLNLCDFVHKWNTIDEEIKNGFLKDYKNICSKQR